ncbi:tRNA glutamyl-Q(34) synthetase GluQRS [Methylosoma difficile]
MPESLVYRGRFAPSPTGPLHLGSLYTALASFLQAHSKQGQWLLRIDDLDTPRNVAGAADRILKTLDNFGLHWDGAVDYQSQHLEDYQAALETLRAQQQVYACVCSRKSLAAISSSAIYPGICRNQNYSADQPLAWRVKTDHRQIHFNDLLQGEVSHHLASQHGDFILKRKEGIIAYPLAVVVDDTRQQINHIVRGVDLLDATPKQIYLQQLLGLPLPGYMHVPVIVDQQGQKLSKQTLAAPVDEFVPQLTIFRLLQWLRQNPPDELQQAPVAELLAWAILHWQPDALKKVASIALP